eukprot:2650304-Alexandrium_andersonii.AAC.1
MVRIRASVVPACDLPACRPPGGAVRPALRRSLRTPQRGPLRCDRPPRHRAQGIRAPTVRGRSSALFSASSKGGTA